MEHATYLAIDVATIAFPLIFSFHPRIGFVKEWRSFWPACLLVAIGFVIWDVAFTRMGVWGFNERYVLGPRVAGLPVEELFFFICVPYSCVFTYFAIGKLWTADRWSLITQAVVVVFSGILCAIGLFALDRWYTVSTALLLVACLLMMLWMKTIWLARALATYVALLPLFYLVNGLLTGSWLNEPVVWYNDAENLGLRVGTIPVEDIFYGLLLVLLNIQLFERLRLEGEARPAKG